MPSELSEEEDGLDESTPLDLTALVSIPVVEEENELFRPSTCPCEHCVETNYAVRTWNSFKEEAKGAIRIIVNAIEKTEQNVLQYEDDKQFAQGCVIDLQRPHVPRIPHRFLPLGSTPSPIPRPPQ